MNTKNDDQLSNFIPISRDFFEHKLWKEKRIFSKAEAWLFLIKEARFSDSSVLDGNVSVDVKRGQLYNSLRFYGTAWGWSTRKVTNFLGLLSSEDMLKKETVEETGQTMITICNYDRYNGVAKGKETVKETRRKQQGNAKETKSNKDNKDNKDKNVYNNISGVLEKTSTNKKNIEERELEFKQKCFEFSNIYDSDMLNSFYLYWTEKNEGARKMRFEKQETFQLDRRLITWNKKNEEKKGGFNNGYQNKSNVDEAKRAAAIRQQQIIDHANG